jgi:anti-sigma B factor antagonist
MQLDCETIGADLVVRMREARLDAAGAIAFKEAFRACLQGPATRVILDLSCVTFMDSSGLGAVVAVLKAATPARAFALAGLTPAVARVFKLTRMDSVFSIYPDLAAAMAEGRGAASGDGGG